MNFSHVSALARTLLYEGYVLYPYRGSSLKNQKRWAFGTLYPPGFQEGESDRSSCRMEILVRGIDPTLSVVARFLQPIERRGPTGDVWHEAKERQLDLGPLAASHLIQTRTVGFAFAGEEWRDAEFSFRQAEVRGDLSLRCEKLGPDLYQVVVTLENCTNLDDPHLGKDGLSPDRNVAYLHGFASAHFLLGCESGVFVSVIDPPRALDEEVKRLSNEGVFPVLVNESEDSSTVLASPFILSDNPALAPESPGDLFDATEIDEILSLRILTLTEDEKREAAATDPRVARLLARTETLDAATLARIHGTFRDESPDALQVGAKVLLEPKAGGDVFDLALAGELGTIVGVEQDHEGDVHYAVTVDSDPAGDLGLGHYPAHRFYFRAHELRRVQP